MDLTASLEDDQREKLRQYTEFTHQQDYEVAIGTLASLNWNLEQAIEAHLMQEDKNDDEDPEILETIPAAASGRNAGASSSSRFEPEVINIEDDEMPATRGRRRGRAVTPDETTTVDNQIDDGSSSSSNGAATHHRGAAIPRQKRGQATEPTPSSSGSSSASFSSRRGTRANPVPPPNQEPAHPESARQNGGILASRHNNHNNQQNNHHHHHQRIPINPRRVDVFNVDSDEDDDSMAIAYEDDDDGVHEVHHSEVVARGSGPPNGRIPMIPDGFSSVSDALRNFVAIFSDRFCSTPQTQAFMPPFYTEPLPAAVKEAFDHPNSEHRRPLLFYINHDRSIAANIFASQVLCSETVSTLIRHQYVLFPWDITSDSNLMLFLEYLQAANMGDVRTIIQRLAMSKIESFPLMAIVVKERNSYRLVDYCRGTDTSDQVMEKLLSGVSEYSDIRMNEQSERREREEREAIRNQQEAEYKASLAADKARMEAKQQEIEEQRLEEERKLREEEEECVRRQTVASTVPEEPPASAPLAEIINVKFRLPEGGQDMRRFRRLESIQTLINYLSSKGYSPDKFKYFNSDFPKKEITRHFDLSHNFADTKWPAREQIFVEEI
ncbi:UBX domain-containing protein 3 [Caenorhabditis elegans]|uniref:Isoform b of UBX domain-containing protein 3 n=2 Tax=Caenorhabditis elegans TaxID=6239 RepID=H2L056-2|nr:UBX domain-containing protein 3 [Caenorhabditis elegans]CCD71487.1 UBX domain-containing protein 3 [Caenorhabditis elegans]|eukprot:NP_001022181.2 UBX domain-containing protein 3 [Caenorhabditis elegans]